MERTTFSVLFFIRRTRLNRNGEAPVQLRITVNGQRADASVKKFINPDLWDTTTGRAKNKEKACKELNLYLDAISSRIMKIQRDMELDGAQVTAQGVLDRYLGLDLPERKKLLEVFKEHNEKCRNLSDIDMAPATVIRYETSFRHTQEFIKHTYHKNDVYLDEVDMRFVQDYEYYMKTVRRCSHNTTTKYLKNFKKIIRLALANEWMQKDPFTNIKFTFQQVERNFLEIDELQTILTKEFKVERVAQVRDVFLFCCFTGLAFFDVKELKTEHIISDNDGAKWIRKRRQKTRNMCNIPLLDIPLQILEKYATHPQCLRKGVLLPVTSNQKMNAYLKEIADLCGIDKQLTTHCARHTFATVVTLANGISMESVSKMLGHSNLNMTRHYARILDRTIKGEMQNIKGLFTSKTG